MYEDKELKEYRDLLQAPDKFEDGFGWKSIVGAIFIGFLMMPGSMYLGLVIGTGIGPAARWVTIILFAEIAKRAYTRLSQQEIFVLYYMAGAAMASPFSGLLWNQYLVQSEAARMLGLTQYIPTWVAPMLGSDALADRTFFHRDWLIPILLMIGFEIISAVDHFGLGYALYRLTSDVEKLPFPMAPVGALGNMALAESTERDTTSWKWRIFSIGGMIGLVFGALYVLLPAASGVILSEPIQIFPIPWIELTHVTEDFFPAVATGIQLDLGLFFIGMVLPFWAVIGGGIGFLLTLIANPILYEHGILHRWHKGMATVDTIFANNFDFYMSFGIGLGLAIAAIGIFHVFFSFKQKHLGPLKERSPSSFHPPKAGVISASGLPLAIYVLSTTAYIILSSMLVPGFPWIFLVAYGFIYTPIISYVSARMEGIAGQFVSLPMVREASFIAAAKFFGYYRNRHLVRSHPHSQLRQGHPEVAGDRAHRHQLQKHHQGGDPGGSHRPDRQPALFPIHLASGADSLGELPLCSGTVAPSGLEHAAPAERHPGGQFALFRSPQGRLHGHRHGVWES